MANHQTKVAVVGAGSFVFGPSVLHQTIFEQRLDDIEIALVDVDAGMLDLMKGVGERMKTDAGSRAHISATTQREEALRDADFVICCAAPQMRSRHETDRAILAQFYPETPVTEFGGLAGLSYSLRQMAFVRPLARDMARLCPGAWLLDASNPLPRVCQAAHEAGEGQIKVAGFCYYALAAYMELPSVFGTPSGPFPWKEARQKYQATIGGLNHFSWIVALRDGESGADLMPALMSALAEGKSGGNPRNEAKSREVGAFLIGADSHVASDFLAPSGPVEYAAPYHGADEERARRLANMRDYANGGGSLQDVMTEDAWEKPMDLVAALAFGREAEFPTLNLINDGQIPNLPRDAFVQTAATASTKGVEPQTVTLPEPVRAECERVAGVTSAIVRAGRTRKLADVREVVELDPTIEDKARGWNAAQKILEAHADMIGAFA